MQKQGPICETKLCCEELNWGADIATAPTVAMSGNKFVDKPFHGNTNLVIANSETAVEWMI